MTVLDLNRSAAASFRQRAAHWEWVILGLLATLAKTAKVWAGEKMADQSRALPAR